MCKVGEGKGGWMGEVTLKTKEKIGYKAGAFADDFGVPCGGDLVSVRSVYSV